MWGFQARLLPYLEAKDIYNLCNFRYQGGSGYPPCAGGDCFDWIAIQPQGQNPAVMIPSCLKCPSDPLRDEEWSGAGVGTYGCTAYLGVMGTTEFANDGILLHGGANSAISLRQITDGASHTFILGERGLSNDDYGWPYCGAGDANNTGCGDNLMSTQLGLSQGFPDGNDDYHFWSYHINMCQFIMADGSGGPVSYDISFSVFQALSTRAGGEVVQTPWDQ